MRGESLTIEQMMRIIDGKNISSINFGTGENALNPDFSDMIDICYDRGIKLSVTSNGYTINILTDEQLTKFHDVDVSLDFPDQEQQNDFRKGLSWNFVAKAIERLQKLNIEFSITTALMNANYKEIPILMERAAKENCNMRINIFKPVPKAGIYEFQLDYDQFWESIKLLFRHGKLVSCSEPIVNAMLDIPSIVPKSPCGLNSLRIHPDGIIVPCVYWSENDVTIDDITESFEPAFKSKSFIEIKHIPDFCADCEKVDICGGGCASRRFLNQGLNEPDSYCPIFNKKEKPVIEVTHSESAKDLVHSSYLCTMIFEGK